MECVSSVQNTINISTSKPNFSFETMTFSSETDGIWLTIFHSFDRWRCKIFLYMMVVYSRVNISDFPFYRWDKSCNRTKHTHTSRHIWRKSWPIFVLVIAAFVSDELADCIKINGIYWQTSTSHTIWLTLIKKKLVIGLSLGALGWKYMSGWVTNGSSITEIYQLDYSSMI